MQSREHLARIRSPGGVNGVACYAKWDRLRAFSPFAHPGVGPLKRAHGVLTGSRRALCQHSAS